MIWKTIGHFHHLLLVGATYLIVLSLFDLELWPNSSSQLQGGLAIAWFYMWSYMRDVQRLRERVSDLRSALDIMRRTS